MQKKQNTKSEAEDLYYSVQSWRFKFKITPMATPKDVNFFFPFFETPKYVNQLNYKTLANSF